MEKLQNDIGGNVEPLLFTLAKTREIPESGNVLAISRTIVKQEDTLKLQVVEEKFKQGEPNEDIARRSEEIEHRVAQVDAKVTHLNKHLATIKTQEDFEAKETEKALKAKKREDQLKFKRTQFEQKMEFELKLEESKKNYAMKSSQFKTSEAPSTKLPKLSLNSMVLIRIGSVSGTFSKLKSTNVATWRR